MADMPEQDEKLSLDTSTRLTGTEITSDADPYQALGSSVSTSDQELKHEAVGFTAVVEDKSARALSRAELMREAHMAMTYLVQHLAKSNDMRGLTFGQQLFLRSKPGMGRFGLNKHEYHKARMLFARGPGFKAAQRRLKDPDLWDAILKRQPLDVRMHRPYRKNHAFLKMGTRTEVGMRTVRLTGENVVNRIEHLTAEVRSRQHGRRYIPPAVQRNRPDWAPIYQARLRKKNEERPQNSI